jgi:hypothetical protein
MYMCGVYVHTCVGVYVCVWGVQYIDVCVGVYVQYVCGTNVYMCGCMYSYICVRGCTYVCVWGCIYVWGVCTFVCRGVCTVCMSECGNVYMCVGCMYVLGGVLLV